MEHSLDTLSLLLAAGETAKQTAEKTANQNSGLEWQGMAVAAVTAILVMAGLWLAKRWRIVRARQLTNSPAHLLQELCVRHGLGRAEQRLLAGLAREQRLEHPAQLFVDPRLWETGRTGSVGKRYAAQLDRLRERVFGAAS
jgi:hypothetical protein